MGLPLTLRPQEKIYLQKMFLVYKMKINQRPSRSPEFNQLKTSSFNLLVPLL